MQNISNTSVLPPHEKVKQLTQQLNRFRSLFKTMTETQIPFLIVLKLMTYIMICISIKVNVISVHILLKVFIAVPKKKTKIKDEMNGAIIKEFVGLRTKMYSMLTKVKGVQKSVVEHRDKYTNYVNCLLNEHTYLHRMTSIRSSSHLITMIMQNKKSLTPYDNKYYLLDDGIHTVH